jgi:hypothetical protein
VLAVQQLDHIWVMSPRQPNFSSNICTTDGLPESSLMSAYDTGACARLFAHLCSSFATVRRQRWSDRASLAACSVLEFRQFKPSGHARPLSAPSSNSRSQRRLSIIQCPTPRPLRSECTALAPPPQTSPARSSAHSPKMQRYYPDLCTQSRSARTVDV